MTAFEHCALYWTIPRCECILDSRVSAPHSMTPGRICCNQSPPRLQGPSYLTRALLQRLWFPQPRTGTRSTSLLPANHSKGKRSISYLLFCCHFIGEPLSLLICRHPWLQEVISRSTSNQWFASRKSPASVAGGMAHKIALLEAGNTQASLVDVDSELSALIRQWAW
jgi:hypothetical protein